jgi:hypothetical protein
MGQILRLPIDQAAFTRLIQHERAANIAAERAVAVKNARAVLRSPKRHSDQVLRDACAVLTAWGNGHDQLTADAMIFAMNRREQLRLNEAKQLTSVRVAMQHRDRWPAIAGWGLLTAAAMLAGTGWL